MEASSDSTLDNIPIPKGWVRKVVVLETAVKGRLDKGEGVFYVLTSAVKGTVVEMKTPIDLEVSSADISILSDKVILLERDPNEPTLARKIGRRVGQVKRGISELLTKDD